MLAKGGSEEKLAVYLLIQLQKKYNFKSLLHHQLLDTVGHYQARMLSSTDPFLVARGYELFTHFSEFISDRDLPQVAGCILGSLQESTVELVRLRAIDAIPNILALDCIELSPQQFQWLRGCTLQLMNQYEFEGLSAALTSIFKSIHAATLDDTVEMVEFFCQRFLAALCRPSH